MLEVEESEGADNEAGGGGCGLRSDCTVVNTDGELVAGSEAEMPPTVTAPAVTEFAARAEVIAVARPPCAPALLITAAAAEAESSGTLASYAYAAAARSRLRRRVVFPVAPE